MEFITLMDHFTNIKNHLVIIIIIESIDLTIENDPVIIINVDLIILNIEDYPDFIITTQIIDLTTTVIIKLVIKSLHSIFTFLIF